MKKSFLAVLLVLAIVMTSFAIPFTSSAAKVENVPDAEVTVNSNSYYWTGAPIKGSYDFDLTAVDNGLKIVVTTAAANLADLKELILQLDFNPNFAIPNTQSGLFFSATFDLAAQTAKFTRHNYKDDNTYQDGVTCEFKGMLDTGYEKKGDNYEIYFTIPTSFFELKGISEGFDFAKNELGYQVCVIEHTNGGVVSACALNNMGDFKVANVRFYPLGQNSALSAHVNGENTVLWAGNNISTGYAYELNPTANGLAVTITVPKADFLPGTMTQINFNPNFAIPESQSGLFFTATLVSETQMKFERHNYNDQNNYHDGLAVVKEYDYKITTLGTNLQFDFVLPNEFFVINGVSDGFKFDGKNTLGAQFFVVEIKNGTASGCYSVGFANNWKVAGINFIDVPYVYDANFLGAAVSVDTLYLTKVEGGRDMLGNDGQVAAYLTSVNNTITIDKAKYNGFIIRGWAGLKHNDIDKFGYNYDNGAAVVYGEFKQATEDAVINAGGESRMEILCDITGLSVGNHTVVPMIKLVDGGEVSFYQTINLVITDSSVATAKEAALNSLKAAYDAKVAALTTDAAKAKAKAEYDKAVAAIEAATSVADVNNVADAAKADINNVVDNQVTGDVVTFVCMAAVVMLGAVVVMKRKVHG